jgi:hypothetical protein
MSRKSTATPLSTDVDSTASQTVFKTGAKLERMHVRFGTVLAQLECMQRVWLAAAVLVVATQGSRADASLSVKNGDELQAALNAARPGDTILLDAGVTYTGHFRLPARNSTDNRVITVQTGGPEAAPPGRRITPAAAAKLAKLQSPDDQPVLQTSPGARFWQIALIEFLPNAFAASDIITLGDGSSAQNSLDSIPSDITLDRVYIHGDPARGQKRGVALNSARTTISNSYISDIKAVGQDSQAVGGWNGPGNYTIQNNYLEASGENIMFGGTDPTILNLVPTHITITGNTMSKPLEWRGSKWEVKNLLELKNAIDVTIDSNVFEHNWLAAQSGYGIVVTGRNQDGGCPWCQVQQVQFTRNVVRGVEAGINILGFDDGHTSRQTNDIAFRNNLFDGVGGGYFLLMTHNPKNIVFDHNTIIAASKFSGILAMEDSVDGFVFTNNITPVGEYGMLAAGKGIGNDAIRTSMPGANITGNVLAGASPNTYPPGNFFPSVADLQGQVVDVSTHDYRLKTSSRWARTGTDGKDPGANGPSGAPLPVLLPARH